MTKNLLFKTAFVAAMGALFIGLESNNTGKYNGGTSCGANGSCHNVAGTGTTTALVGLPTTYTPGTTYTISPTVSNSTLGKAGYNLLIDKGTLGLVTGVTSSKVNTTFNQATHTGKFTMILGFAAFPITWTAPAAGSGAISFKVVGNAINDDGDDTGDSWSAATFTLAEAPTAIANTTKVGIQIAHTATGISITNATVLKNIQIIGMNGNLVKNIASGTDTIDINTSDINTGYYILKATENGKLVSTKFFAH